MLDWGRIGDDFYWSVNDNEDPIGTYVFMRTVILQTGTEALLNVECEDGQLGVNLYWKVEDDIDWTVFYWVDDGSAQEEEWIAGRLGDEHKWTGREDARDLIAQLAWAAQTGGRFTVEAHERRNPNRRYTATWPLNGLFETPIQPNLARCGQY